MAKEDFCFTYYDGDAARDKAHMNRLERGAYDDIISAQRKFGHLTKKIIEKILSSDFEKCWEAIELILKVDADGKYFIDWLEISIKKSKEHSEHQRKNAEIRWEKYRNAKKKIGNATALPLEDGDGNENGNEKEKGNEKGNVMEKVMVEPTKFEKTFSEFLEMRKRIKKPATEKAIELIKNKLHKLSNGNEQLQINILEQSIISSWQDVYELKTNNNGTHQNTNGGGNPTPKIGRTEISEIERFINAGKKSY